jgi:hypothetical protein
MATKELFDKIAAIRKIILKDSVSPVITPVQLKGYWAIVNKETSSSEFSLLFGHYIVGSKSDIIAHYHAARVWWSWPMLSNSNTGLGACL